MSEATEPFIHVLLFQCPKCGCPLPWAVTSLERNVDEIDGRAFPILCNECRWSGSLTGTQARRHWVDTWDDSAAIP